MTVGEVAGLHLELASPVEKLPPVLLMRSEQKAASSATYNPARSCT